jgi:hypothetical protein
MATHDYVIANASGAAVRADLNNALAAIVSNNSGSSEPGTTYAFQWWADTNASQLKLRNAANDDWVVIQELDGTMLMENGTVGSPGLAFASDLDTGFFRPAANQLAVATNGIERVEFGTTEVVFNDGGNDIDFRVEGDTEANLFFVDAGNDAVSINGDVTLTDKIIHSGDTNTAIRFPAADTFAVETAGSEAIRVDSSGRLLVGTASGSSEPIAAFQGRATDVNDGAMIALTRAGATPSGTIGIIQFATGSDYAKHYASIIAGSDGTVSSSSTLGNLRFSTTASGSTSAAERMRLDSSGRLLVGTSSSRDANFNNASGVAAQFQIEGTSFVTAFANIVRNSNDDNPAGFALSKSRGTSAGSNVVVQDNDKIGEIAFQGSDGSKMVSAADIEAQIDGTPGSGDMPGRLIFSTNSGGTGTTERMRIKNDGAILVGQTSDSFSEKGTILSQDGRAFHVVEGNACLWLNRRASDGDIVEIYAQDAKEGSISVSGSTVSYNGAHLSRWSQLPENKERVEILRGSVLSNLDEMCEWAYAAQDAVLYTEDDQLPEGASVGDVKTPAVVAGTENNEQLNRMKVSDTEGDKNVSGVFQAWDDDDDTYTNDFYCAMTGDFVIRIAKGTTVERGDLLMSAGDGTAKPQDDDIVRSKTIAKVTSNTVSTTYSDGSYCVPCVLMAC